MENEILKFHPSFRLTCLGVTPECNLLLPMQRQMLVRLTEQFATFYCRKNLGSFCAKDGTTLTVITEQQLERKGSQLFLHCKNIWGVTLKIPATPSGPWTAVGGPAMRDGIQFQKTCA